jgi:serine/threonine protein kinase
MLHCVQIAWTDASSPRAGLKYMHSGELLHRDIKPSNLLLNAECQVKVADFGLARSVAALAAEAEAAALDGGGGGGPILTDYVATRWYRAPEILLGSTQYTFGVDMWSCGCILAELLSGRPAFPGASTLNQLDRIMEVTGAPSSSDLAAVGSPFAATMLDSLPAPGAPRPLRELFPGAAPDALDLLRRLLQFSPARRLSAEEALRHPYVAQFHNPAEEPAAEATVCIPIDDNTRFGVGEYRDKLYGEIVKRKKELRRRMREREAAKAAADAAGGAAAAGMRASGGYGAGAAARGSSPPRGSGGAAVRGGSPQRRSSGVPPQAAPPAQQRYAQQAPPPQQQPQATYAQSYGQQRAPQGAYAQQAQQAQQYGSSQQYNGGGYQQPQAYAPQQAAPRAGAYAQQRAASTAAPAYGRAQQPQQQQPQPYRSRSGAY